MNNALSPEKLTKESLKALVLRWQINLKKLHEGISIQGSPERSLFRVALEDEEGRYYLLEQIPAKSLDRKRDIAAILFYLSRNKLRRVLPYLPDKNGEFVAGYKNGFWQISPFVPGIALDRENYIYEKWHGPAMADFLIDLHKIAKSLPEFSAGAVFSLKNYVYKLIREINIYKQEISAEIRTIAFFLEKDFLPVYEKLPVAFCHGDYHPLNIIWSANDIRYVIDWEFCGYKSELYDTALLIGCIGVEDPQNITGELVKGFMDKIKEKNIFSKASWKYLVEFIVALRFAWLAEWLRKKDEEMIRMELDYMRILMENKGSLEKAWP